MIYFNDMEGEPPSQEPAAPPAEFPWHPLRRQAWHRGILVGIVLTSALGWILARVVWLWFYFGLFFFLIAGLLVGAVAFRVARAARPLGARRILAGAALISIAAWVITVFWEYHHVATTIGVIPKYAEARNAAIRAGRPVAEIDAEATDSFKLGLRRNYPPGGPIGYVRWAVTSGEMDLAVRGYHEKVSISQRGYAWPLRSLISVILLAAGLWSNLESLRSPEPVSNLLVPGEEAPEDES